MDPISTVASVIAIYQLASAISGLCFRYGQGVRQADRDADLVINEIDTFQRYLRTLKEMLVREEVATAGLARLRNLHQLINGESAALEECRRDLQNLKTKLDKVQSGGRFQGAIHKLSWPLEHEEVKKTLDTLRKFTEAVDRALNVDNNHIVRQIDSTTKRMQTSLESAEAQEIREKVLNWLAYPDPSEIHEIVRRDRNDHAKTGRWFLDGNAFDQFRAAPQSVLWLHGDSGSGKSVLCSAVIDEIIAIQGKDPSTKLAYWYFSVTDKKRTSLNIFLRALVAQLVLDCPIPPSLLDLWRASKMGREAPKSKDLAQTICKIMVTKSSHIHFLVIDAVDEADETERAELIHVVRSLALLKVEIHILITSRTHTVSVEKEVKGLADFYNIAIEGRNVDADILAHVTERLQNDNALAKWSTNVRELIKDTLIEEAGGMFRWVECQLQAVRKCRTPAQVKRTLKALPRNLHEVYARDLAKVDKSESRHVIRLLEWLAFPQRKLRLVEAIDMLAVDTESDSPAFDEENRMVDSEEILNMCGSLIRLDRIAEGQSDTGDVAEVKTLAAAHASVVDFLTTQPVKVGPEEVFNFSRGRASLRMAETCLVYLRHFSENSITWDKDMVANYPFAPQSAMIWHHLYHEVIASSERLDLARLNNMVMELFSFSTSTLNWLKLFNPDKAELDWLKSNKKYEAEGDDYISGDAFSVKPAIYYAAHLGLPDIVQILIHKGYPMDEVVGPPFGTPLVAASAQGRTNIVSLLLDSGADPNLSGYFYWGTPLAAAISFRQYETVELLSGRAGVNMSGRRHPALKVTEEVLQKVDECRYLHVSVGKDMNKPGDRESKKKLIELGTELIKTAEIPSSNEVKSAGSEKQPNHPIQSIESGITGRPECSDDLGIMHDPQKFLIRTNAFLKRFEKSTQSMVYIAADIDTLDILKILLAAGADPNIRGGRCGTALQSACTDDSSDNVVEILLKNGAKPDVYGGYFGSPLIAACMYGSFHVVEDLIKAGADVNRLDARWSSPLHRASITARADVVKLLLKHGASTDKHADGFDTPLFAASKIGAVEIVEILLNAGSDVNWKAEMTGTALYVACRNRDVNIVKLLLTHGADPNIQQCGDFDHALQAACTYGDEEVVSLLLNGEARTDLYGGYYDSALQAACVSSNESITRMLLSHGADATHKGGVCGNAMLAAVDGKNEIIVDILLELGVSIMEKGGEDVYPLLRALSLKAWDGQDSFVHHLLDRGADPNLDGHRELLQVYPMRRTPLQYASSTSLTAMLLDHGARIDTVTKSFSTALIIAATWKSEEVVRLLLDRGADVDLSSWIHGSPLGVACRAGRLKIAKLLVEAGADFRTTNLIGHSALLMTVSSHKSQLELLEYLIREGADPLQEDKRGCNGLHYAARAKKADVIKKMIEYGINVNTPDHNGWSPLHWAVACVEDSVEVVKLLLELGCDKSMKDKQGRTALDLAKTFMRVEEATILGGPAEAYTKSSSHGESQVQSKINRSCDGCSVHSEYCTPESWHRCNHCDDIDFCFRCILDKDIIHFKDHSFSNDRP